LQVKEESSPSVRVWAGTNNGPRQTDGYVEIDKQGDGNKKREKKEVTPKGEGVSLKMLER